MKISEDVVIGLDLGTGGVRAIAATIAGQVLATASGDLDEALVHDGGGRHEQDPEVWWRVTCNVLQQLMAALARAGVPIGAVAGIAVDGTSGTLVCAGADGTPLRPAIMYNDARSAAEAERLNELAGEFCTRLGYRFAASYSLAKIAWVQHHEPEVFDRTRSFLHQADFIVGRLLDRVPATDYSNALKSGYDLQHEAWPAWIGALDGVLPRLPSVLAPGQRLGTVAPAATRTCSLPAGLPVIAGATDGTAAVLASGVRQVGDYNTTLGTTLVFKAVGERLVCHPQGLIYSHKLPGGRWLPGAASNTGGEWIPQLYPGRQPAHLDAAVRNQPPALAPCYPLVRQGERFPFPAPQARGILPPERLPVEERYAACLQGTALVERLAYEVIDRTAGLAGGAVFTTGGGSRSEVWTQIRADATGRVIHRPHCPESAFGSAVLAAAGATGEDLWDMASAMVRIEASFEPDRPLTAAYDELYARLIADLRERGWL